MNLIKTLIYLLVGYLVAVWMHPDVVSLHLTQTDWSNVMVYVWVLLWQLVLLWHFILWAGGLIISLIGVGVVICLIVWFIGYFNSRARKPNRWRN